MYIDAVCKGIDDIPDVDPAIRQKYSRLYKEEGLESLRVSLKLLDPLHYHNVDLKNPMRIMRALEICESTGRPYSAFLNNVKRPRDFRVIKIGLRREKEVYERINRRVDTMISQGLETEAKALFEYRNLNALNTVGYKEFFDYFKGKISNEKAIGLIRQNTRRYAKRQMTWWARDKEISWFDPVQIKEMIELIEKSLKA